MLDTHARMHACIHARMRTHTHTRTQRDAAAIILLVIVDAIRYAVCAYRTNYDHCICMVTVFRFHTRVHLVDINRKVCICTPY